MFTGRKFIVANNTVRYILFFSLLYSTLLLRARCIGFYMKKLQVVRVSICKTPKGSGFLYK